MFLDDFKSELQKQIEDSMSNVIDFQKEKLLSAPALVKLGVSGKGNLSEKQIAEGERGQTPQVNTDNSNGNMSRSIGFGMDGLAGAKNYLVPVLVVLGIAGVIYLARKK